MNTDSSAKKTSADVVSVGAADGTIRIEHDRRRLALAALARGLAALIIPCMFFAGNLHRPAASAWTLASLGLAIVIAALGFVRSIIRLQDGDPALVLSPRGLDFRPTLLGEIVRIPWKAVLGYKSRSYKQQRYVILQVDDIDRYAPRVGFAGFLRRIGRRSLGAGQISFGTPMSKSAWSDVEAVLNRYLAQHGRPGAAKGSAAAGAARQSVAALPSRTIQSRSSP